MRTNFTLLFCAVALLLSLLSIAQPAAAATPWTPFSLSGCLEVRDPDADFALVGHANITHQGEYFLEAKPWGYLFSERGEITYERFSVDNATCEGEPLETQTLSYNIRERNVDGTTQHQLQLARGTITYPDGSSCALTLRYVFANGEVKHHVDTCT